MSEHLDGNGGDPRPWYDRHGPLAFAIVGAVLLLSLLGVALRPASAAVIVPSVAGSLAAMHYGRERARQNRERARAGNGGGA